MADPISMALAATGSLFSNYGASRVNKSNERDVKYTDESFKRERATQTGYEKENAGNFADTLNLYTRPETDARLQNAVLDRQNLYRSPMLAHDFNHALPADYGDTSNSVVARRNAVTGNAERSRALAMADAKGKLDAFGDATMLGNILAANNANKIGMVSRIAQGSQRAEGAQQALLPGKLAANEQNAGATYQAIGDWIKMGAMVQASGGGLGTSAAGVPTDATSWLSGQGVPGWLNGGYYAPNPNMGPPLPAGYVSPFAGR